MGSSRFRNSRSSRFRNSRFSRSHSSRTRNSRFRNSRSRISRFPNFCKIKKEKEKKRKKTKKETLRTRKIGRERNGLGEGRKMELMKEENNETKQGRIHGYPSRVQVGRGPY